MTNQTRIVASFTFRTHINGSYEDSSFSVLDHDGRLMVHTGDDLLDFESFLARNAGGVGRILAEFRNRPQLLDGSEIRQTYRMRNNRRVITILGGPLHGRQF